MQSLLFAWHKVERPREVEMTFVGSQRTLHESIRKGKYPKKKLRAPRTRYGSRLLGMPDSSLSGRNFVGKSILSVVGL